MPFIYTLNMTLLCYLSFFKWRNLPITICLEAPQLLPYTFTHFFVEIHDIEMVSYICFHRIIIFENLLKRKNSHFIEDFTLLASYDIIEALKLYADEFTFAFIIWITNFSTQRVQQYQYYWNYIIIGIMKLFIQMLLHY